MSNPDPFLAHEALDRACLFADMVETYLLNHSFIEAHPDIYVRVREAVSHLDDAYQMISNKTL